MHLTARASGGIIVFHQDELSGFAHEDFSWEVAAILPEFPELKGVDHTDCVDYADSVKTRSARRRSWTPVVGKPVTRRTRRKGQEE